MTPEAPTLQSVDDLDPFAMALPTFQNLDFTGEKFPGGFGPTQLFALDYWTLRQRSAQLFTENPYARGLIRRLITNEINTGLTPEACPDESIIEVPEDSLTDWSEEIENRFGLWGKNPQLCDFAKRATFGAIQRAARMEALVAGDVLVVLRQNPRTKLPTVQLVSGAQVRTPLGGAEGLRKGHKVTHGVETNAAGVHVAFWVTQVDGSSKRLPAFGEKSGRRIAWLVYGCEKRLDEVRGTPLLSLVLQSLKEIDRYRDSTQRKAVINSILAMFIEKTDDKPSSLPVQGGAVRNDKVAVSDSDGTARTFNIANQIPGVVFEELQKGEKPVGFRSQGTEESFGIFESAVMQAIAWTNEVPPEILMLAFSNNYSASQAAINEFKIYLNKVWSDWGETFCTPIYVEVMISQVLQQKITAPGLLQAWRTPSEYDKFAAWISVDWYGSIKPSTDMLKQVKGSKLALEEGLTTRAREARGLTGTKFKKNVKKLAKENADLAAAARPMLELQKEFGTAEVGAAVTALNDAADILAVSLEQVEAVANE